MKYFIKTFGCQMNHSDSERIAGFLEMHKIKPVSNINEAALVIFNTCGVRQMAEDRVYGQIHNLAAHNSKRATIILTGCLANRKDVQRRLKNKVDLFCDINEFPKKLNTFLIRHPELDNKSSEGSAKKYYQCAQIADSLSRFNIGTRNDGSYLNITPKYSTTHTAYIPIMTGCNNFCSYCVVPYARGREISRPAEDIIEEIKKLTNKKCKEIILLGQNVNSYRYKKIRFPNLLNKLAKNNSGINFKFLTSHPKDFSEELMDVIFKNQNISRVIHLPVQAGSDKILKLMNRPYTRKKYLALVKKIKNKIPEATFTTDVIVGFPGETKKDFQESINIFKQVGYAEAYINKYSPRPGTAAFRLGDPVTWEEKKRREKELRKLIKEK